MNILLIEDEPSVAGIINRGLTENGYRVTVAPDGNLGLQMALDNGFDVMILDIIHLFSFSPLWAPRRISWRDWARAPTTTS